MILYIVNVLLFECTFAVSLPDINLILLLLGHIIIVGHGVCYLFAPCFWTFLFFSVLLVVCVCVCVHSWGDPTNATRCYFQQQKNYDGFFFFFCLAMVGRFKRYWNVSNERCGGCSRLLYIIYPTTSGYSILYTFIKQYVSPTRSPPSFSYFFLTSLFVFLLIWRRYDARAMFIQFDIAYLCEFIACFWFVVVAVARLSILFSVFRLTALWIIFAKHKQFRVPGL